jgi:hypothetical protein
MPTLPPITVNLHDRIYLERYKNCRYFYLNWVRGRWLKSDQEMKDADVILKRTYGEDWEFIKISSEDEWII